MLKVLYLCYMNSNKANPHSDQNGHPKPGEMHQFFAWQSDAEAKRREKLSSEEVKQLEKVDDHLAKKMNS